MFHVEHLFALGAEKSCRSRIRDRDGRLGMELTRQNRRGARKQDELMGGPGRSCRDGDRHIVYRTQRDGVKTALRRERFCPCGPDFDVREPQGSDGLTEERRLLVLGFGEDDADLRPQQRNGEAGKAGSRAEVEQGVGVSEMSCCEEALAKVAADDFLW